MYWTARGVDLADVPSFSWGSGPWGWRRRTGRRRASRTTPWGSGAHVRSHRGCRLSRPRRRPRTAARRWGASGAPGTCSRRRWLPPAGPGGPRPSLGGQLPGRRGPFSWCHPRLDPRHTRRMDQGLDGLSAKKKECYFSWHSFCPSYWSTNKINGVVLSTSNVHLKCISGVGRFPRRSSKSPKIRSSPIWNACTWIWCFSSNSARYVGIMSVFYFCVFIFHAALIYLFFSENRKEK